MESMPDIERPQRSDALRNRQRLLEAAAAVFAEQGLDAGVGEIAARAGVGRGTLFRNFASKEDLIAAIVVERMRQAIVDGRRQLETGDAAEVPFIFLNEIIRRQQEDRSLFEAVADEFLANPDIRAIHADFVELVDEMLDRGKRAGSVRPEVGAMDVMMLVKGACAAASALEASPELLTRHIALLWSAISTPGHVAALPGAAPRLAELEAGLFGVPTEPLDVVPEPGDVAPSADEVTRPSPAPPAAARG